MFGMRVNSGHIPAPYKPPTSARVEGFSSRVS